MTMLRAAQRDDGLSLVLTLMIVTVFAAVAGAVISQATTSVLTTVAFRDQAGAAYNADAAANIAVNTLRRTTWSNTAGSQCFTVNGGPSSSLTVPYSAATANGNSSGSAYVTCAGENGTGSQGSPVQISNANKPGQAIFAHGNLSFGAAASETDYVRGSVSSGATLTVKGSLSVTGTASTLTAAQCPAASGSITPNCSSPATGVDPGYAAPAVTPAAAVAPTCPSANNGPEVFSPGVYKQTPEAVVTCPKTVGWLYFKPGIYYFNYSSQWQISKTIVGGTLDANGDGKGAGATSTSPSGSAAAPSVPGACVNPILNSDPVKAQGVELVFGGTSRIYFDAGTHAEFCATYTSSTPPTSGYGLSAAVGSGANLVPALSGCILDGSCYLIDSKKNGPEFYFEGFFYSPKASLNLNVNNVSQPFFNFGLIVNNLFVGANPSTKCNQCAFINLPDNSPGFGTASTIVDLVVYVCTGTSTCSAATGHQQLTARVLIYDPTGTPTAGARQMKILSWSQQR